MAKDKAKVAVTVRPVNELMCSARFKTFKVVACAEVHHTTNCIRSVKRSSAIFQNFDAADSCRRKEVDV